MTSVGCTSIPVKHRHLTSEDNAGHRLGRNPGASTQQPASTNQRRANKGPSLFWRRRWDSNPRTSCPVAGFQDRCFQPLSHSSGAPNANRSLNVCGRRVRILGLRLRPAVPSEQNPLGHPPEQNGHLSTSDEACLWCRECDRSSATLRHE